MQNLLDLYRRLPPNMVTFFEPTDAFLRWLVDYIDDRYAIEVGAGQCKFTKKLISLGVQALAIEPRPETEVAIECSNFLLPFPIEMSKDILSAKPAVVIAARPDHSGWFETLLEMLHPEAELLYIGLQKNVAQDIPKDFDTQLLYEGAGYEGEIVLRVSE